MFGFIREKSTYQLAEQLYILPLFNNMVCGVKFSTDYSNFMASEQPLWSTAKHRTMPSEVVTIITPILPP